MKRGKPLRRTASLKASTPLARIGKKRKQQEQPKSLRVLPGSSFSDKRTPLKARSEKTARLYDQERVPLVKEILFERPWCQACPVFAQVDGAGVYYQRRSVDCHEILSRARGGSIVDETNILAVCRPCHRRITENPSEAQRLGLARSAFGA